MSRTSDIIPRDPVTGEVDYPERPDKSDPPTVKIYWIVNEHGVGTAVYGVSCEIIPDDCAKHSTD